jgi:hypothetical protein
MTLQAGVLDVAMTWCRATGTSEPGRVDGLLTGESVVYGLSRDVPLRGPAAIQRAVDGLAHLFPGKTCELLEMMAQDDRAAVRWRIRYSPGAWHMTGMPTEFDGMTMCTVRHGRIVELYTSFARWWV